MKTVNKSLLLVLFGTTCQFCFASANEVLGGLTYELGGKIRFRSDYFNELYTHDGRSDTETYMRRADFNIEGKLWDFGGYDIETKTSYDGDTVFKNFSWNYKPTKHTEIILGRYTTDYGLEQSGSSAWATGVETATVWDLAPYSSTNDKAWGGGVRYHSKHWFMGASLFDTPEGYVWTNRLIYAPIANREHLLHIGISYAKENAQQIDGEIKSRLAVYGIKVADNGNSTKLAKAIAPGAFKSDQAINFEASYKYGPFSIQSEYIARTLISDKYNFEREAVGYYVQAAYTLTGESRDFDMKLGRYGKIKPSHAYGAWEIFIRADHLQTDGEIGMLSHHRNHGEADVKVVGVNWYSPVYWKLSLNYIDGKAPTIPNNVNDEQGKAISFQAQIKF